MKDQSETKGINRRGALECMIWAGTGILWTVAGGVPKTASLLGVERAEAQVPQGFSFLQISDSHIGFGAPASNPNALATLQAAIAKTNALDAKPAFMIHTGDITHLSKPQQFDDADQAIGKARLDVHMVPGEHDVIDAGTGALYLERYGKKLGAKGGGWYSFDAGGMHFVGLVNVLNLKAGGMGSLGAEQIAWLADDLKDRPASTPIVVFAHVPLWTVYRDWGWGTDDAEQALALTKRFGSVTVLNGHIHQIMQKVEGSVSFYTARSTAFPMPAPGTALSPGPMNIAADKLRGVLGIRKIDVTQGTAPLAITDSTLA